jgi:hypothetical protein
MPNPWLNEQKSTAAMNYFLTNVEIKFSAHDAFQKKHLSDTLKAKIFENQLI